MAFCATAAITCASSVTSQTFKVRMLITCRAIGTTGNAMFTGEIIGITSTSGVSLIPATSPAVSSSFNSTVSNTVDFFATWGTANSSNTITLDNYTLKALN